MKRAARQAVLLVMAAALASPAQADPPPLLPGLDCQVEALQLGDSLRLQLRFSNQSDAPITLPAGPHLVYYRDAEASDAMLVTARLERLPSTSMRLPPHSQAQVLMVLGGPRLAEFRCNGQPPAAAGLNFYRYSQWPQFRCLLSGYPADAVPMRSDCPDGNAAPGATR